MNRKNDSLDAARGIFFGAVICVVLWSAAIIGVLKFTR